jgi:membrane protease YdiL (CAAX protease family)
VTDELCSFCGTEYKPNAAFCASCGHRRIVLSSPTELPYVIKLYVAMLGVMLPGVMYAAHVEGADAFTIDVVLSSALGLVIVAFALARRPMWWPLYKTAGFGARGYLAVIVAAPVVLALVLGYVQGLAKILGIQAPDEMASFDGHHIGFAILLVAIVPPIIEELAFRGLIYTGLRKTFGVSESFIISSFAFALLHLSIPSLITHLPLGLYFCYLRYRSESLWPAMLAHALHNGGVIAVSYLGWT